MASDAINAQKRAMIITHAMKEVDAGSHYIKGSSGSIPGENNSGLFRDAELLENLNIKSTNFGVFAAKNIFGNCPGRWKKMMGGWKFALGQYERDILLPAYLEELKTISDSWDWHSFNDSGCYPRRSGNSIYLGEDCWGKRHFDCEGFIAWVLIKALGKDKGTWRQGVDWYQSVNNDLLKVYQYAGGGDYKSVKHGTITQNDILDGDILIRKPTYINKKNEPAGEHIAFACIRGTGVLEASGQDWGVIRSTYTTNWTQLARIKSL